MKKVIITCALTGSVPSKDRFPAVPITVDEIVNDAIAVYKAGAAVVHIHVRDRETGKSSHDFDQFMEIKTRLNAECPELIVQLSTGGRYDAKEEERDNALRCLPDMVSYCPGCTAFPGGAYINRVDYFTNQAKFMLEHNIKPEIEIFDTNMLTNALDLYAQGLLAEPLYFDFVMGVKYTQPSSLSHLGYLLSLIPKDAEWNLAGVAGMQNSTILWGLGAGGHVRVGLEDNQYLYRGVHATNVQLVERVVRIAKEIGREVATPDEARAMLSIAKR